MKKLTKVTSLALLLSTLSPVLASQESAPICALKTQVMRDVLGAKNSGHQKMTNQSYYDDFRSVCLEALAQLNIQFRQAHDEWRYGSQIPALDRLHNALKEAAEQVIFDSIDVPPHSATTILHAYEISAKLKESTARNLPGSNLAIQVEFMMLTELINMINWANESLDNPHYRDIVSSYITNNYRFNQVNFTQDYLHKVKSLSLKFINVYRQVQDALVTNPLELDVAYSFSKAAKTTLNQSLYRRSFCSAVVGLEETMKLIEQFQCGGRTIPSYRQVDIVRNSIDQLASDIRYSNNHRCY